MMKDKGLEKDPNKKPERSDADADPKRLPDVWDPTSVPIKVPGSAAGA
jgi:hypothetical protein